MAQTKKTEKKKNLLIITKSDLHFIIMTVILQRELNLNNVETSKLGS